MPSGGLLFSPSSISGLPSLIGNMFWPEYLSWTSSALVAQGLWRCRSWLSIWPPRDRYGSLPLLLVTSLQALHKIFTRLTFDSEGPDYKSLLRSKAHVRILYFSPLVFIVLLALFYSLNIYWAWAVNSSQTTAPEALRIHHLHSGVWQNMEWGCGGWGSSQGQSHQQAEVAGPLG